MGQSRFALLLGASIGAGLIPTPPAAAGISVAPQPRYAEVRTISADGVRLAGFEAPSSKGISQSEGDLEIGSVLLREPGTSNIQTAPIIADPDAGDELVLMAYYQVRNLVEPITHVIRFSIGGRVICEIEQNESSNSDFRLAICGPVMIQQGLNRVVVELDATNRVFESNENNNTRTREYDTFLRSERDFAIGSIYLTRDLQGNSVVEDPQPGEQLFIGVRFNVIANVNYFWRLFILDGNSVRCRFLFFFPDGSREWNVVCNIPVNVPDRPFSVTAELDPFDAQQETDEDNNFITRTYGTTNEPPIAAFDFSVGDAGLTVDFTDMSSDSDGTIESWDWDFGDNTGSTQQNPSRTYAEAGIYTVTLTVTDDGGATDSVSQNVMLEQLGLSVPASVPTPGNIGANDRFGTAVGGSGSSFAVGAPSDESVGVALGSVVTFIVRDGVAMSEGPLEVPDGFTAAGFGSAIDQQGNLLAVGAPGELTDAQKTEAQKGGLEQLQAALFERTQGELFVKAPIMSSSAQAGDEFGSALAVDGDLVLVGAPGTNNDRGAAYLFEDQAGEMVQIAQIDPPANMPGALRFGQAVAASNGKFAVGGDGGGIGAALMGAVGLYDLVGGNLRDRGVVTGSASVAGDGFGTSVALSGNTLLVGSPGNDIQANDGGATYLFDFAANQVTETGRLAPSDPTAGGLFGSDVSIDAGNIVVGSPGGFSRGQRVGAAYAYKRGVSNAKGSTAPVTFLQKLEAPEGHVGFGTSVEAAGNQVFFGAPDTGPNSGAVSISAGLRSGSRLLNPILAVDPSLGCPGFYIARVDGLEASGRWSMEILLEPGVSPFLQGGLNLGGGFGTDQQPGFAAFNIANPTNEAQTVTIDVNVVKADGISYQVEIINRTGGGNTVVFSNQSDQNELTVEQTLNPGFYSMRIYTIGPPAGSERGVFTMSLLTGFPNRPGGAFQGGVNLGGIISSESEFDTNEGFAAVCIDTRQTVRFTTFGDDAFGAAGIDNINLRVLDRARQVVVEDPGG